MRITNKMLSNNFLRDMRTNLNNLSTLQNQMASGKQIRRPSDDPAKASKIMQMYSEIDANKQYNSNIKNTSNWLDTTDTVLGQIGEATTRIQELLISAGNAGYGPDERAAVKDEINQKVGELSQMLNTNFDGKYIFGGTHGTTPPVATKEVDGNNDLISNTKYKVVGELTDGKMTYSGKTVEPNSTFTMYLNEVPITVTTTLGIANEDPMNSIANNLQDSISTAILAANDGKSDTDVGYIDDTVTVTTGVDGRFTISATSGSPISFSDISGKTTTEDLGLSVAKAKLLVEVSQGVTMDYNVTATQVINYGTGYNLMELLGNITSHLDSGDTSALANTDLKGIQDFSTNVLKLRSQVGAKQNSMESAQTRNDENNLNMTEILSATEDIDITEKAMEYATMQTIYLASLQTSAKVIQPSLLDYL